jgi:hypothetical protein
MASDGARLWMRVTNDTCIRRDVAGDHGQIHAHHSARNVFVKTEARGGWGADGGLGMAMRWLRGWRRSISVVVAIVAILALAEPAFACSTGDALTVEQVGASARLIVVADVLSAPRNGLDYRLRVVDVIHGSAEVGQELTIGPASPTSQDSYPDCWLSLPVGTRAVIALISRTNLDALASYAWWDEAGHVVSASPVESWPDTIQGLVARLRAGAGLPPSDTVVGIAEQGVPSLGVFGLLIAASAAGLSWRRFRTPRQEVA